MTQPHRSGPRARNRHASHPPQRLDICTAVAVRDRPGRSLTALTPRSALHGPLAVRELSDHRHPQRHDYRLQWEEGNRDRGTHRRHADRDRQRQHGSRCRQGAVDNDEEDPASGVWSLPAAAMGGSDSSGAHSYTSTWGIWIASVERTRATRSSTGNGVIQFRAPGATLTLSPEKAPRSILARCHPTRHGMSCSSTSVKRTSSTEAPLGSASRRRCPRSPGISPELITESPHL